ncbi:MAG: DHHA1 domain-containing protein, partial [Defluviitaleaceae bacterium]|nr:DHHA1 domain-containing protein [Defluviitaleaceae bacterium]
VDEDTHESIAGIVAGRIKDKLHRPTILLTKSADADILKGSARSIEGYNIFEALFANGDLLARFGGHAMAAGMSLTRENADKLRKRLNETCTLQPADLQGILHIDRELQPAEITVKLATELEWLAPFGKANPEPLFVTYNLKILALRDISEKNTLIFTFENGLKGIAFGLNQEFAAAASLTNTQNTQNMIIDIVHTVETNTYNGKTTAQMRIKDFNLREN